MQSYFIKPEISKLAKAEATARFSSNSVDAITISIKALIVPVSIN